MPGGQALRTRGDHGALDGRRSEEAEAIPQKRHRFMPAAPASSVSPRRAATFPFCEGKEEARPRCIKKRRGSVPAPFFSGWLMP